MLTLATMATAGQPIMAGSAAAITVDFTTASAGIGLAGPGSAIPDLLAAALGTRASAVGSVMALPGMVPEVVTAAAAASTEGKIIPHSWEGWDRSWSAPAC
jgi:hypothetical protein